MFFNILGNEKKLAQSIQSDYRRNAEGVRVVKSLKAQIKKIVTTKTAKPAV